MAWPKKKNEENLRDLKDTIKQIIICIMQVRDGDEREKGTENLCEESMAKNFLNLGEEIQDNELQLE